MLKFTVYELDEALVVRAALDAAIEEMKRQKDAVWVKPCSCAPYESESNVVAADLSNPTYAAVLDAMEKITAQSLDDQIDTAVAAAVPFSKEEVEEASKFNEELYALVHKKGKKSAEQKARMYALTEQVRLGFEAGVVEEPVVEESVGKALAGVSAADLQALLEETTAPISQTGAVQVRSLLPNFLEDNPAFGADESQTTVEEPAQVTNSWEQFTDDQLLSRIEDLQQNGMGIHWFKNVVALGGGNWLKMPRDHMIAVLADPDSFTPTV